MHIQIESTTFQHFEGAASLASQRILASHEPHYSLRDIVGLDDRLQSHCEALAMFGGEDDDSTRYAEHDSPTTFVQTVVAERFRSDRDDELSISNAICYPDRRRFFTFALGWIQWSRVSKLVDTLQRSDDLVHQSIGLKVCQIHRRRPVMDLSKILKRGAAIHQPEAILLVSHLPAPELLLLVSKLAANPDSRIRAAACRALAMRGGAGADGGSAKNAVAELAKSFGGEVPQLLTTRSNLAESSHAILLSRMEISDACNFIQELAKGNEQQIRLAVISMGLLGIPDSVPWLLQMMSQPEFARVAGESFYRITGLRLDQRPYEGDWPDGFEAGPNDDPEDENVEMDEDENLPWPEVGPIAEWWEQNRSRFKSNVRYLLGFELDNEEWLRKVLVLGRQRERATAALELAIRNPTEPLFNVEEHGRRQMKKLGIKRLPTEEYRCNHIEAGPDDHTWKKYLRKKK